MGTLAFLIGYAILVAGPLVGLAVAGGWFVVSYVAFAKYHLFLPGLTVFLIVSLVTVFFYWGLPALLRRRAASIAAYSEQTGSFPVDGYSA